MRWHIELESSPDTAPLYLGSSGDRLVWTPDRTAADSFRSQADAWDRVLAAEISFLVRVRT